MTAPKRAAEDVVKEFWQALSAAAARDGWLVGRVLHGRSNRGFVLEKQDRVIELKIRVSQVAKGFWGLPYDEANAILAGRQEHNLFLTARRGGYLVTAIGLLGVVSKFSKSEQQKAYKVNEEKLLHEPKFQSAAKAWELLRPPAPPPSATA